MTVNEPRKRDGQGIVPLRYLKVQTELQYICLINQITGGILPHEKYPSN
jgi:hypothetical protein